MLFFLFHFLFHSLSFLSLLSLSSFLLLLSLVSILNWICFQQIHKIFLLHSPTNSFLLFPFSFSASFLFDLLPLCKLSSVLSLVVLLLGKPVCWSHTPEIISLVRAPPLCLMTTVTMSLLIESQSIFNCGILQLNKTMITFALCHTVRQMYFFSASLSPHQHHMKMSAPSGTLKFNTTGLQVYVILKDTSPHPLPCHTRWHTEWFCWENSRSKNLDFNARNWIHFKCNWRDVWGNHKWGSKLLPASCKFSNKY